MGNTIIYNVEQGSDAWHDLKCGRITASKFGVFMQDMKTKGYKDLIYNTVGQILCGTSDETFSSTDMKNGIEREPEAADFYGDIVDEVGFVTNKRMHPEYFGVSPDRMVGNALLEIKCPLMKTHIFSLVNKELPKVYQWQIQGQIMICEAEYCDFMSWYKGIKPFVMRVYPDIKMQNELRVRMGLAVKEIESIIKTIKNV